MAYEKYKRWFLETLYVVGMIFLLIAIADLYDSPVGYLVVLGFMLLVIFGLLYLRWFKIWQYE